MSWIERLLLFIFPHRDITKVIDGQESLYLRRWYIVRTRWFRVFLHKIVRSDEDRHLHDHPWNFTTIILKGGYDEEMPNGRYVFARPFMMLRRRCTWRHRVHLLERPIPGFRMETIPCWSLFIAGKRRKNWGFYTENGFVPHEQYADAGDSNYDI